MSLLDALKKKESVEMDSKEPASPLSNRIDEMKDISNTRAILAGATPLLVGLLTGGKGDAAAIASKGLYEEDKRAQKEQNSLMDYLQKQQIAQDKAKSTVGNKRYQQTTYEDEYGNIQLGILDTSTGQVASTGSLKGYRRGVKTDPRTGELIDISGATGEGREFKTESQVPKSPLNVKEEKDVRASVEKLNSDPIFRRNREAYNAASRALPLLQAGNPVADEGIKTIFPRMFGEVGNLAINEQERFSGSPELKRRWFRLKNKWEEGLLTDEDRSDLIEVAKVMGEFSKNAVQNEIERRIKMEASLGGDEGTIRPIFESLGIAPIKSSKVVDRARSKKVQGEIVEKNYKGKKTKFKKVKGGWEIVE